MSEGDADGATLVQQSGQLAAALRRQRRAKELREGTFSV